MSLRIFLLPVILFSVGSQLLAQDRKLSGILVDSSSGQPISGATVIAHPGGRTEMTDDAGRFVFRRLHDDIRSITVSAVGFGHSEIQLTDWSAYQLIRLSPRHTVLGDVVVSGNSNNPYRSLADSDIGLRGTSNSQEIFRMVPGLFVGQHQGGGKAEQIFLRGFDEDHGKDIRISVDGLPVNMVSHAHAQGYADSHFIIPETIDRVVFDKGPYDPSKGDQATTGYLDFFTANGISNSIKLEAGQFQTYRLLAMMNFLKEQEQKSSDSWYAAIEYTSSDSYFEHPQHFKRFNFFTRANLSLSPKHLLTLSASAFHSSWFASGQIPQRLVDAGKLGHYGAVDPNEGGLTSRQNLSVILRSAFRNGNVFRNQLYFTRYGFDLFSNFTFFLTDTVNGDEIRQREKRNLFGYSGNYCHEGYLHNMKLSSRFGLDLRWDAIGNSELSHTKRRYQLLNRQKFGDVTVFASGLFIEESVRINPKWRMRTGLRFDHFYYQYNNKLSNDSIFTRVGRYSSTNSIFSPKLTVFYDASTEVSLYFSAGKGFHSNDARVTIAEKGDRTLPSAYGTDLGLIYKPAKNFFMQTVLWYMYLSQEYVYAGDGGTVDFSGRTGRFGIDISLRYQPEKSLLLDVDLNWAHGRSLDENKGNNRIPLAPILSGSGGLTLVNKVGWNGSIRYRFLTKRPANPDYSLSCEGYLINDVVIKYKSTRFEYGIIVNNIFNVKWKETQFESLTKLKDEPFPVNDITFTAGTKFSAKMSISYSF